MDKTTDIAKRFTEAQGLKCEPCTMGDDVICPYEFDNIDNIACHDDCPYGAYTLESIKTAIQAWPCGTDCENGRIEVGGTIDGKPMEPDYVPCPDCTAGKRSLWSSFLIRLYGHILESLIDGFDMDVSSSEDFPWSTVHAALVFGRIITTPETLMAEFLLDLNLIKKEMSDEQKDK